MLTQKQACWYTTLQKYSFEVIPKLGSANMCADALSYQDKLLGEEGIPEPVTMLPNACRVVINTNFAAKVHAEAENKQAPDWFDQVPEG